MSPLKGYIKVSHDNEKFLKIDNIPGLKEADEVVLWDEFKLGHESAIIHIYNTYFEKLLNIGCQFTNDKSLIKDCIQDLFIDLINRKNNLGNVKSIKLYLYKSFRRRIVKYIQFDKKKHSKENDIGSHYYKLEISHEEVMINAQLVEHQKEKIAKGIRLLSEKEREAIYYFYFLNLSYKEICEIFKYNQVKTVRSLVYQALKKLKAYLDLAIWVPFLILFQ